MQNKCLEEVPGAKRAKLLEQRRGRLILAAGMRMKSPYFQFSTTLSCREPIDLVRLVSASVQSYIVGAQTTPRRDAARSRLMADGTIHSYLEIYRFGLWLLMDGSPGLKPDGSGPQPAINSQTSMIL